LIFLFTILFFKNGEIFYERVFFFGVKPKTGDGLRYWREKGVENRVYFTVYLEFTSSY